jgi:hypothetical protein
MVLSQLSKYLKCWVVSLFELQVFAKHIRANRGKNKEKIRFLNIITYNLFLLIIKINKC